MKTPRGKVTRALTPRDTPTEVQGTALLREQVHGTLPAKKHFASNGSIAVTGKRESRGARLSGGSV
jgi:hypothetical protein